MLKLFEVKGGKLRLLPQIRPKRAILGVLVLMVLIFLGNCAKLTPKEFWEAYVTITRHFGLEEDGPPDTEKKTEARIRLDVDKAITEVTPEYEAIIREADKKYQPIIIDLESNTEECYTDECRALGPPMRICAPWVEDCPK